MKTIQYAIDTQTGLVVSRVDSELAWPVLDYKNMTPANDYQMNYKLEKMSILVAAGHVWNTLKWTRKIPIILKNKHRTFWGMKPLKI